MLGSVAGVALTGLMLAVMLPPGGLAVELTPNPDYWNAIGFSIIVLFVLALMEELVFRSYSLVRLFESFGMRTSIYCTSLFFALYHGLDPANLLGPGVWGILFGLAAIASRGIALPLGFHFGLNWMQSLFGMKTQFASSIWTIVPGTEEGIGSAEFIGLILQLVLLATGVLLVERQIRRHPENRSKSSAIAQPPNPRMRRTRTRGRWIPKTAIDFAPPEECVSHQDRAGHSVSSSLAPPVRAAGDPAQAWQVPTRRWL